MGGTLSGGEDTLYAPRRAFDEEILVLPEADPVFCTT
jgi:hypothetical protein